MSNPINTPLSIAPMIDWTYTHFRVFMRLLAPKALLYTEMITTGAIEHNHNRVLSFNPIEHPIALQLGGADPKALANAAVKAQEYGYDEVNLNLGCPSDKVQSGHFGACLMKEPDKVVACIKAMRQAVTIPITIKTRIGVDNQDSYEFFRDFVLRLVDAGSEKIVVHARKAWLNGLSPKQNRTIPPVVYEYVYKIKQELGLIPVVINGNINDKEAISQHLSKVDGVMLGRLACDNPYKIAEIHHSLYPEYKLLDRREIFSKYKDYVFDEVEKGSTLSLLLKPVFNLFHGMEGTRQWKQNLMSVLQLKDVTMLGGIRF